MNEENSRLNEVIKEFLAKSLVVSGIYIATLDGLLVAHSSKINVDPDKVAAMIASLSAVGDRVTKELLNEESMHVVIQARNGYVVVKKLSDMVISALAQSVNESSLGMVLFELERFINILKELKV